MTRDRATGLAFIGVSRQTEARLDKYVEFLARWRKVSERAFSQVWTRHLAEVQCLEQIRENARSYGRSLVRPMLLPAFMAVVSKCSIPACCHLWTQSPLGHWLPCLVSLNLPMSCLCSRVGFYREDDRRQHRLKPFRERPNSNSNASDITLIPTLELTAFTAATAAHRLKNDPRRSPQLDEKRRGCNRAA